MKREQKVETPAHDQGQRTVLGPALRADRALQDGEELAERPRAGAGGPAFL
jgi:hypothetical protein